jgi:hypothetical protein
MNYSKSHHLLSGQVTNTGVSSKVSSHTYKQKPVTVFPFFTAQVLDTFLMAWLSVVVDDASTKVEITSGHCRSV